MISEVPWQIVGLVCGVLDKAVNKYWPAQAWDVLNNRDYEAVVKRTPGDDLNGVEAETDVLEPGELRNWFYCNRCGGGYYTGKHDCLRPTDSAAGAGADSSHLVPPGCGAGPVEVPPASAGPSNPPSTGRVGSTVDGEGPAVDSDNLSSPTAGQPNLEAVISKLSDLAAGERARSAEAKDSIPFNWHNGRRSAYEHALALIADALAPPLYTPPPDPDTRWDALSRTPH